MRVIDLALKDLLQITRDWKAALFLVAMPIGFTLFMGLLFRPGGGGEAGIPVAWVDQDAGAMADELEELLAESGALALRPLERIEAHAALHEGDVEAILVVPEGFSAGLLAGESGRAELVSEPTGQSGQAVAEVVRGALAELSGAVQAAILSTEASAAWQPFAHDAKRHAHFDEALALAWEGWADPPITLQTELGMSLERERAMPSGFAQSSPGMIVQFTVFGLMNAAIVLVEERRSGALRRLLTTPISRAGIIAGKVLAMFTVVFAQQLILVGVGQLFLGVGYLREPLALLLVTVPFALCSASLGLLIATLTRTEPAVIAMSLIVMFIFTAMGGGWFPLEVTGRTFSAIGHLFPTAWAMDGFQDIVVRGLGVTAVLPAAGILLAYALAFFLLAVWRFRFE